MKLLPLSALVLLSITGVGCRDSGVAGTWKTAAGLQLDLKPDKAFSMSDTGNGNSAPTFGGTWKLSGDSVHLNVTMLGGEPLHQALADGLSAVNFGSKMSPTEQAEAVKGSEAAFQMMDFKVAPNRQTLTWDSNGQTTTFTRI